MALPFRDGAFDASLAVLTIHHWPDWQRGIQELRRVASERVVIVTWDPAHSGFWLTDYFLDVLAGGSGDIFQRCRKSAVSWAR